MSDKRIHLLARTVTLVPGSETTTSTGVAQRMLTGPTFYRYRLPKLLSRLTRHNVSEAISAQVTQYNR